MKLDFKRIMSAVLALTMMVSSLVMVNVVSVSAAEKAVSKYDPDTGAFLLLADDFADKVSLGTDTSPTLSTNAGSSGANLKFGGSRKYTYQAYNTYGNSQSKPATNNSKYTFDNELLTKGSDTIKFTPKKKGTVNVYLYVCGSKKYTISYTNKSGKAFSTNDANLAPQKEVIVQSLTIDYYDADSKTLPEVTMAPSASNIAILAIEYIPDAEESTATGWQLDFTGSDVASEMQSKIGLLDENRTQSDNWLTYSDNDYVVNPDRVHITGELEGTTYKYTPMMSDFIKTKGFAPTEIHFDGISTKKYVRLDCEVHGDSVHTIYLDEEGNGAGTVTADPVTKLPKEVPASETGGKIWLPEDTYYVTIAGGTVVMTEPAPVGEDKTEIKIDSSTTALKGTFTPDVRNDIDDSVIGQKIDLTAGLKVNDDVDEAYISNGAVIANYFEVYGNQGAHGDFALIRSEHMDTDGGERSNVAAIELKTVNGETMSQKSSLRFHVADGASSNLSIRIMCSSSTDTANPSKIGLRTGSSFADNPHEFVTPETIPAEKDGSAEGKMYTFEVENLTPGGYYGIYNAGTSETDDDVRIYSIEFYEAKEPATVTPEATKYAFKAQEGTSGRLVTNEKKDPEYTGAYANYDSDELHVEIADGKATLHDANADSVEMIMPLANTDADGVTSGTVKFSGTLTLLNTDGSKWSLLDFRDSEGKTVAAIRTSNNTVNDDYSNKQDTAPKGNRYALAIPNGVSGSKQLYDYHETKWEMQKGSSNKLAINTDHNYDITFDYTEKTITLHIDGEEAKATDVTNMPAIAEIKGITGASATDRNYEIGDITIEATSATKYPVKLSGTNNTEGSVDLKVMKGTQLIETVTIDSPGAFSEKQLTTNLAAGTYALTAEGCVVTPSTITVKDSGSADTPQEFKDIKIETSYNVNVKFDFAADSAASDSNITITELKPNGSANGSGHNLKDPNNNSTKEYTFTNVAPGTQFKISGTSRNTYQWLSRRNGKVDTDTESFTFANKDDIKFFNGKNSKYFVYTVPLDTKTIGTAGDYGVQFKADSSIGSLDLEHKNMKSKNDNKKTGFGQFGFGEDKKKVCGGKDARENVMEYRFEPAGMDDYISHSYCATVFNGVLDEFAGEKADITTGNEFGILNKDGYGANTFIKFTTDENVNGQAVVDRSGEDIEVYDNTNSDTKLSTTDIKNTAGDKVAKQSFKVVAGHTYTIKTASSSDSKRTYVKSIRIYNPDNVFDNTNADAKDTNTKKDLGTGTQLQISDPTLFEKINAASVPDAHIFRVIGTIHLADATDQASAESELANIDAVGFDVYTKAKYDELEGESGDLNGNHVNGNSSLDGGKSPTPDKGSIEFKDIVNASVDTTGDGTADITADSSFKKVYVQTFYAASESMVLVPWVQYSGNSAKVYSLIKHENPSNNIVLEVTK